MKISKLLVVTFALLVLGVPAMAQIEGTYNRGQDDDSYARGRDADVLRLAAQLTQQSDALSRQIYSQYLGRTANNQSDTQTMLAAYQLNSAATVFRTMINDRRRRSELRDVAAQLDTLARTGNGYGGLGNWSSVQRTVQDIQTELSRRGGGYPGNGGNGGGFPGGGGASSGRIRWSGTVDDVVQLNIQGNYVDPKAISGTPYNDATSTFSDPLPNRSVSLSVRKMRGRGDVRVVQQPSRSNDFTAIVEIRDSRSGSDNYDLEITW
jgi:hypothetical protein